MAGFSGTDAGKPWNDVADPIVSLLNHSDCDGELTCDECATVGPRLRELVAKWDDADYDKINALKLADTMQQCADNDWDLIFC